MSFIPGFWEWIVGLDSGEQFVLITMGGFSAIFAIGLVTTMVCKMHKNRLDDALKRELLDRGMTADEIATVVRAKPGRSGGCGSNTI